MSFHIKYLPFSFCSSSLLDVRTGLCVSVLPSLGEARTRHPTGPAGPARGSGHQGGARGQGASQPHHWSFPCKTLKASDQRGWIGKFLCVLFSSWTNNDLFLRLAQRLDVVWRDARWIMDCLQCVRSRQWVGAVPLGLVMGGDPPARPDGEEEDECLTARLTWPHRIQAQRQAGTKQTLSSLDSSVGGQLTHRFFRIHLILYVEEMGIVVSSEKIRRKTDIYCMLRTIRRTLL